MAQIVERAGKTGMAYLIRVSCGYDASGRQITKSTTYRPPEGISPVRSLRQAQRYASQFELKIRGCATGSGTVKMRDFCWQYLDVHQSTLSPSVYLLYSRVVEVHIIPLLGHLRVRDVKTAHVQQFINALQRAPLRGREGHLASGSIHRYFTVLKSVMAWAQSQGCIGENPTLSAQLSLPKLEAPEVSAFTEDECALLLSALEDEGQMWRVLINLAIVTGARRGELCALRWENIDLQRRTMRIVESSYHLPGQSVQTKSPKTAGSVRTVTFDAYCARLLSAYRGQQRPNDGGWVFTATDGGPISPQVVTGWFERFQRRHGIEHHRFHALRHTSGTLLLMRGTNIKTVASRLGHTQLTTVNRYVHALEQADIAAASTFDDLRRDNGLT
jgi:integrase